MIYYNLKVQYYNYSCSLDHCFGKNASFQIFVLLPDNPQSTSNPVIRPVIPVSTTVSSNSSQNITSRLTSDENIVEVLCNICVRYKISVENYDVYINYNEYIQTI